jgi:hypothetical protein
LAAIRSKPKYTSTATWQAGNNLWGVDEINFNGTAYPISSFTDYVKVSVQDSGSRSETLSPEKVLQGAYSPQGARPLQK